MVQLVIGAIAGIAVTLAFQRGVDIVQGVGDDIAEFVDSVNPFSKKAEPTVLDRSVSQGIFGELIFDELPRVASTPPLSDRR